ncbi:MULTISPECIES: hypothetical protein [Alteromonadaceae]|jgi:hypothetical protein|uniref:Porin n=1 Tax=Brumicola blandensis TaxID=3075611 RepID=A0AAW8R2I9_9ALTE|nr:MULTISPECIES: hypothetical protein [unclassified Alteromonas]MDT0583482.1 hypothetical protein [Alteromonas sp. W409]MDT0629417.1 hypothetical protein [Alteromonas sp. W364]
MQTASARENIFDTKETIEFSGFGRIVGGYLDDKDLAFQHYQNNLSFTEQSLLALRVDAHLSDKLKLVTQGILHTGTIRENEVQWLYLQYQASRSLSVRLGRQRMPFFDFSETNDVGFAYPWITPPIQVYTDFLFFDIDGIMASYEFSGKDVSGAIESYFGEFEGELTVAETSSQTKLNNSRGLILKLNYDSFTFRASHHITQVDLGLKPIVEFRDILRSAELNDAADSIGVEGSIEFSQLSLSYDSFDYFMKTELTRYDSDFLAFPDVKNGYITLGYNFYPYSLHLTYANSVEEYDRPDNLIPVGINSELDALSFGFDQILMQLNSDGLESVTLGLRYDYSDNVAFKTELAKLNGDDNARGLFTENSVSNPGNKANFFQVAVEWVF